MQPNLMELKILLPFKVFAHKKAVKSIVANTDNGFVGLLPNRLDCVAVLVPGIVSWQTESEDEAVIAVDDGILVKVGKEVLISVRNAIGDKDILMLNETVRQEFMRKSEQEKEMRLSLAKLESGFIRRFVEFQHG